jgi:hypothetical protein
MAKRCPYCSFDPTSDSDYCDEHRPSKVTTNHELALIMIREMREALARGTKHYDVKGNLLATEKEIIKALIEDGRIVFQP